MAVAERGWVRTALSGVRAPADQRCGVASGVWFRRGMSGVAERK